MAYWTTPTKECGDDRGADCKDYSEWVQAWTEIKGCSVTLRDRPALSSALQLAGPACGSRCCSRGRSAGW